jgi:tRNA(fMet)-specific endonuclease VapC
MTRILADTSAYSAFFRGHAGVKRCFQQAEEIVLTPVVLGELRAGFLCGKQVRKNDRELGMFLASDRVVVLPVDAETSERYAVILFSLRTAGTPVPTNDVWIAATAMQHGLSVVTTDRHFANIPQILCEILPVSQ